MKEFVYASSTDSLRNNVAKKYSKTNKTSRGMIMFVFLTLREMFQMSREIGLAMISFIEYFKKKGMTVYS